MKLPKRNLYAMTMPLLLSIGLHIGVGTVLSVVLAIDLKVQEPPDQYAVCLEASPFSSDSLPEAVESPLASLADKAEDVSVTPEELYQFDVEAVTATTFCDIDATSLVFAKTSVGVDEDPLAEFTPVFNAQRQASSVLQFTAASGGEFSGGNEGGGADVVGLGSNGAGTGAGAGKGGGKGAGNGTGTGSGDGFAASAGGGPGEGLAAGGGRGVFPPRPKEIIKGEYPAAARRAGAEGKVILSVEVLATGKVGRVEIAGSAGHAALDNAARQAVRQWIFFPAEVNGQAVAALVRVPYVFQLK